MQGNKMKNISDSIRKMVFTALFTALIIVGTYISIPLPFSPVPIVLATFFIILSGLVLGKWWGMAGSGLYLFLGALGLPVFSGGGGGIAHFVGPTGGYLIAYLLVPFVIGLIANGKKKSIAKDIIALITGSLLFYIFGVPVLKLVTGMTWGKAIVAGMLPFLLGDSLKVIAAIGLTQILRPVLSRNRIIPTFKEEVETS
jgi:biotin transport system substrate-specific component